MSSVRVAIVGVGNCAASLVQGVEYYRDADPSIRVPGLMHVQFGDYHVRDLTFVAAFDVDAKKVGQDLSEAILASENNTIKIGTPRDRSRGTRGHTPTCSAFLRERHRVRTRIRSKSRCAWANRRRRARLLPAACSEER